MVATKPALHFSISVGETLTLWASRSRFRRTAAASPASLAQPLSAITSVATNPALALIGVGPCNERGETRIPIPVSSSRNQTAAE